MSSDTNHGDALRLLVVGGAGHVAGLLRPALEAAHQVRYLDLKPVPGAEARTVVGSVTDEDAVRRAVADVDAVVYLAMGKLRTHCRDHAEHRRTAFDANVQGVYCVAHAAMRAGVKRFVHASSLSVFSLRNPTLPVDESQTPDSFKTYGLTKRLGEHVLETASRHHPDVTIITLRLMHPLTASDFAAYRKGELTFEASMCPTGPNDLARLFVAALACERPGMHIVQATGDTESKYYPNDAVHALLGWWPRGE